MTALRRRATREEDVVAVPLSVSDGTYRLGNGVSTGVTLDWQRFEQLGEKVDEQTMR